ncbi:2742_t:CDS:2 [Funneliformis caledonium]|uniref:2742_t:CDS:1 n=1 Tax=Funneliformis caledonium TaxID=1117310 RepID=A0A9N9B3F9_9GLOM|nr:2742_t:CDS:2 [Funneliformis caledonium]
MSIFYLLFITILLLNLPSHAKKTIPDVLYEDQRFSNLVRALQRTMLLPYINHLETATLFAPINKAFEDDPLITKERMLYHLLYQEIKKEELQNGQLLTTHLKMGEKLGPDNLGQKIRVDIEEANDTQIYVGNGQVIDFDLQADNGIIHVVTEVFRTPRDIYTSLSSIDQLQVFSNFLRERELDDYLSNGNHITIFAPTNDAINRQLQFHERQYLIGECGGGLDDLDLFVKHHLNYEEVFYSEKFGVGNTNVSTVQGEPIKVEKDKQGNIRVADGTVPLKDLLAENGVIHVINNIAIPNALHFTKHKYLCGLRATKFVSAMIKFGLQHYIEDSDTPYTILAPRDEYFDENLISIGKDTLIYHVLEGKYVTSDLFNNMHIKTELRTKDLKNHRQRATVSILQRWYVEDETQRTELRFNDAIVEDQPVEIGNAIIYVLSGKLNPPPPIMKILGSDEQLKSINFFVNHDNEPIKVNKVNGDIFIDGANGTTEVSKKDVLTSSGVLHVVDKVLIPPTLHITIAKLLKGINARTFLKIVNAANLTELVQDPINPFTIFVPSEDAFRKINVSKLISDEELAGRWARIHIVPATIDEIKDGYEAPTLLADDVKLVIKRDLLGGDYNVGVKGQWVSAKLLIGGKAWNGGAVYEIDKVLLPDFNGEAIGRIFLGVIIGLLLSGFFGIGGFGCFHFWDIWKRSSYEEIPSA